jgi:membrane protein implicated in regulation of membrane protease activity
MTKQQAERWVRLAWILGALSGGLIIVAMLAFGSRGVLDPWNIEVCLYWMLAFGIYRRNRIAAVAMVAYYVAVRLIVFGSGVSPPFATSPSAVFVSILVVLVYLQGARGVFALSPPLPSGEPKKLDFAGGHAGPAVDAQPAMATAPDPRESPAVPDPARASVNDILTLGRKRVARLVAMIVAINALVMYGLGRSAALGMAPVSVIGFLLLYQSVRGDVIVLWLRRFHEPRLPVVTFRHWLVRACGLLAIPMTVQDSTFKFDRQAAMHKTGPMGGIFISLIGYTALMLADDRTRSWLRESTWPFVIIIAVSIGLSVLWYRRVGYYAVTTEDAQQYARRLVGKIEGRTGWFAPGVVTIRCADSCWREAVEVCMERAAVAVVDVTKLTESIAWELQTALRLLPPQCLILAYAVESQENEAVTASVIRQLRTELGIELPPGVRMFPYPAIVGSALSAWRSSRSIAAGFARLMGSSLAESPRATTLRAAAVSR